MALILIAALAASEVGRPEPAAAMHAMADVDGQMDESPWLDLPAGPPPSLSANSAVADLTETLDAEVETLRAERDAADAPDRHRLGASLMLRVVALELLTLGRDRPDGSIAVMAGWSLAELRRSIDATLADATEADRLDGRKARRLARFADEAVAHLQELELSPPALDRGLAELFEPLADVLADLEGAALTNHWPPARDGERTAVDGHDADRQKQAGLLLERDELGDDLRRRIGDRLDRIDNDLQQPASRAVARERLLAWAGLARFITAMEAGDVESWIRGERLNDWRDRWRSAMEQLADPKSGDAAVEQAMRWAAAGRAIDAVDSLPDARRSTKRDLAAVLVAIDAADAPWSDDHAAVTRRLDTLTRVIRSMAAARGQDRDGLARQWRAIDVRLEDAQRQLELRIRRDLESLLTGTDPGSDPALSGIVAEQNRLLADRDRLHHMDEWVERVRDINAPAARDVERHLRILARDLLRTMQRDDAAEAMQRFEVEIAWLEGMPFEDQLIGNTDAARAVTGDRTGDLIETINGIRVQWTEAWASGNASSNAAEKLRRLARLLSVMEETAELAVNDSQLDRLSRWGGWSFDPDLVAIERARVRGRLQTATAHAIEGSPDGLAGHLDAMDEELGVIRLGGWILARIGDELDDLPGKTAGGLGRIMGGPGPENLLAAHRETLARIGWMAREADHARRAGDGDHADDLRRWWRSRLAGLLDDIDASRGWTRPLTALDGYDGSNAEAEPETLPARRSPRR